MRRNAALLCTAFAVAAQRAVAASTIPQELAGLPLVVQQTEPARADLFAVLLTGDGGWAELPRDVSDGLRGAGISVVGLNSRRYFRHRRTPEETAGDVERIIEYYAQAWSAPRVLLVGYSRGADVLPFVVNRLTPAVRARIALATLLNPATETRFVVGVDDSAADPPHPGSLPLLPEVSALDGVDLLCVYGLGDRHALCPTLPAEHYDLLAVGHGHHFDHEYPALVEAILARLPGTGVSAP